MTLLHKPAPGRLRPHCSFASHAWPRLGHVCVCTGGIHWLPRMPLWTPPNPLPDAGPLARPLGIGPRTGYIVCVLRYEGFFGWHLFGKDCSTPVQHRVLVLQTRITVELHGRMADMGCTGPSGTYSPSAIIPCLTPMGVLPHRSCFSSPHFSLIIDSIEDGFASGEPDVEMDPEMAPKAASGDRETVQGLCYFIGYGIPRLNRSTTVTFLPHLACRLPFFWGWWPARASSVSGRQLRVWATPSAPTPTAKCGAWALLHLLYLLCGLLGPWSVLHGSAQRHVLPGALPTIGGVIVHLPMAMLTCVDACCFVYDAQEVGA